MPMSGSRPTVRASHWVHSTRPRRGPVGEPEATSGRAAHLRSVQEVRRGPGVLLRRLVRIAEGLFLAAVIYAVLAGLTALAASRVATAALARALATRHVHVTVFAAPFWTVIQGRFRKLEVLAYDGRAGRLAIAKLTASWQNGRIDVKALEAGRPFRAWAGGGPIRVMLWLRPAALMAALPRTNVMHITSMQLKSPNAVVRGWLEVGTLRLPFRAVGRPAIADGGRLVVFRVMHVEAGPITLRSALGIPVMRLAASPLDPVLHVTAARITSQAIVVQLAGGTGRKR